MKRDIWGVFHDGVIAEIAGTVPGTLRLRLRIRYLRRMFEEPGTNFLIELQGCSRLRFTPYGEAPTENLKEIEAHTPEVLYVQSEDPLTLECAEGVLEVEYNEMHIALPSGSKVTYEALVAASEKYWTEWERGPRNAV
jgi:hypothetical protein